MVRQLEWGDIVSNDIHITLLQLQLQSGFIEPLLESPKSHAPHLEKDWITHVRDRLAKLNACIAVENAWVPLLQRVHDAPLMAAFSNLKAKSSISDSRLTIANEVRMWLKVVTISELADVDGACISPEKLDGRWGNDSTYLPMAEHTKANQKNV